MSPNVSGRREILKISPFGRNDKGAVEMTKEGLDSGQEHAGTTNAVLHVSHLFEIDT